MTTRRLAAFLAFIALAASEAPAQQQQTDSKRVLVLIAAERSDARMKEMIDKDVDTFRRFLFENLPDQALSIDELTGKQLTATAVVNYYRKLKVRPTDTLVFYYTGHGSFREAGANDVHTLELQVRFKSDGTAAPSREALARPELRREMLAKKAALTVILTDCCSDHLNVPPPPDHVRGRTRGVVETRDQPTRLGQALFLQARGEVDLTAASKGQTAVCDSDVGSYFTFALRRAAKGRANRPVGWSEYVEAVKAETDAITREEAKKPGLAEVAKAVQEKKIQVPQAFVVRTTVLGGGGPTPTGRASYAVIALDNTTDTPLDFEFRWGTIGPWRKGVAHPDKLAFSCPVQPAGKTPELVFQVRVNGEIKTLRARLVTKDTRPGWAEGNLYELPAGKQVNKLVGKTRGVTPDDPDLHR